MREINFTLLLFVVVVLISCNYDLTYYKEIQGTWNCAATLEIDLDCENIIMEFDGERHYTLKEGSRTTKGTYKIAGNKIHYGTAPNTIRSFRIELIESDSMVWYDLDDKGRKVIFKRQNKSNE